MTEMVNFIKTNCSLAMGYFEEPDFTGHRFGPDSDEIRRKLFELDSHLGNLLQELKAQNLFDKTNIIIVSDHGMKTLNSHNYFDLKKIPNYFVKKMLKTETTLNIWPKSPRSGENIMTPFFRMVGTFVENLSSF